MSFNGEYDLGPIYEGLNSGDEVRWDDLRFPAQGINPIGQTSPADIETDTGLLLFDASTPEVIAGIAQMPHSWLEESTIIPHIHWQYTSTTSPVGNVMWQFDYEVVNNGDVALMTYGTSLTTTSVVSGITDNHVANQVLISSFGNVSMRDKNISCLILWKLTRVAGNAADSYTADARLLELDFHYIVDGRGSQQQYTKTDWGK